ncbi:MAG: TrkA family potassium uptake protein [Actinobacteria bacterium]|nr:TrkA family potassium uptake protein [Actinomycetota bacterium]
MKVAVAGAGNVGVYIAKDLHEAGHEVVVLEQDSALVAKLLPRLPMKILHADACEVNRLQEARLETMDVVVAATGDDEDNLVISLLAKQEFAVPRVVARVNHPENYWLFNETWGVDRAVSTPHLLTALVEEAVSVGSLVRLMEFGDARLVEVTLAVGSPAAGKQISALQPFPREATVVAVVRGEHVIVPRGDTVIQAGDEVMVLVTSNASEDQVKEVFIGTQRQAPADAQKPTEPAAG